MIVIVSVLVAGWVIKFYLKTKLTRIQFIKIYVLRSLIKIVVGLLAGLLMSVVITLFRDSIVLLVTLLLVIYALASVVITYGYSRLLNYVTESQIPFFKLLGSLFMEWFLVVFVTTVAIYTVTVFI